MKKRIMAFMALSGASLFFGCVSDHGVESQEASPSAAAQLSPGELALRSADSLPMPSDEYIASGLEQSGITDYLFEGNFVWIEGDYMLHKSVFEGHGGSGSAPKALAKTEQAFYYGDPVSRFQTYRYLLDTRLPLSWKTAFREAFDEWIKVLDRSGIYFREVTNPNAADMIIHLSNYDYYGRKLSSRTCALALGPVPKHTLYGEMTRVGIAVYVPTHCDSYRESQKKYVAVHELGHTLGFAHTDDLTTGKHIPGTPKKDSKSVFNSGGDFFPRSWTGFSAGDYKAIELKYPPSGE